MAGVWKGKRRDSFRQSPFCIVLLLFTSVWLHSPIFNFATSKQEPLNRVRERSGRALHTSAPRLSKLNGQERYLLGTISKAGKHGWPSVESNIANYSGSAVPIYTAAMHAAVKCGRYHEGADIYHRCRRCCQEFDAPVFAEALHIFRKLKQPAQVRKIWNETLHFCDLNGILALARITAAADEGDVEAAAQVLDLMHSNQVVVETAHLSSAIRSCWGWGKNRHKAATYFFDLFSRFNVLPNVISFTNLFGAYTGAGLKDILQAYSEMKALQVLPDTAFAETYLTTLFGKDQRFTTARSPALLLDLLKDYSVERFRAARMALDDFDAAGVKLTRLSKGIRRELEHLPQ